MFYGRSWENANTTLPYGNHRFNLHDQARANLKGKEGTSQNNMDAAAKRRRRAFKSLSRIMGRSEQFPVKFRDGMEGLVMQLLVTLEELAHNLLCDNNGNDYKGLDINRDMKEQVEELYKAFPNALSKRSPFNGFELLPIQRLAFLYYDDEEEGTGQRTYGHSVYALPFLPLLARLGIQHDQFEEHERGGLLIEDEGGANLLQCLAQGFPHEATHNPDKIVHETLVSKQKLDMLKKLKETKLLKKEDIKQYDLLGHSCAYHNCMPEERFGFFLGGDPDALTHADSHGCLPIHFALSCGFIGCFHFVFRAGVLYFPMKKGIIMLFQKDDDGDTPFKLACEKHGREEVMKVAEKVLTHDCSDKPYDTAEALKAASIDDKIDIDGLFFLIRRQPDAVQKWISLLWKDNISLCHHSNRCGAARFS